jgi:hypothetical protein
MKTWKVITNTGKQADLESGLEKKDVQRPTYISAKEFVHWLAPIAVLMTIPCAHYSGGKPPVEAHYTLWITEFPHASGLLPQRPSR